MDIHISHDSSKMSNKLLNTFFNVETTHWWWIGRKRIIIDILKKYLKKKNNKILDAGCGTGSSILYLAELGHVYGVDISKIAVKFCKKRGIKNVRVANILKLPYKDNFFDLVCLLDVMEHIKDDKVAIKEARRVLKPGGILLTTVPALQFIYSKHDKEQGHFKRYSKNEVRSSFKNVGLKERRISYFNILLSPPIILIRLLSKLGGPFSKLADFDSQINFDISKRKMINMFLTEIFTLENVLLRFTDLPFGISLISVYEK